MSIHRVNKKGRGGFTQLDNELINDTNISFRALGLLTYLLSKPPDWVVKMPSLCGKREEGRDAVKAAMSELIAEGYARRTRVRGAGGRMAGYTYDIFEEPQPTMDGSPGDGFPGDGSPGEGLPGDGSPGNRKPADGVPASGKPGDGFSPPTNTEYKNTKFMRKIREEKETPKSSSIEEDFSLSPPSDQPQPPGDTPPVVSTGTIDDVSATPKPGDTEKPAPAAPPVPPRTPPPKPPPMPPQIPPPTPPRAPAPSTAPAAPLAPPKPLVPPPMPNQHPR